MSYMVAIIGRPNVGKSSLFNRMLKKNKERLISAITEKTPGVTRDRNYGEAEWEGKKFTVIDTGGFYPDGLPHEDTDIAQQVKEQAMFAIEEADLIIHLLDGKEGLLPADREMSVSLRASGKRIFHVVNKIDAPSREGDLADFYSLGVDNIIPVSAVTGYRFDELMDKIVSEIPSSDIASEETIENMPKIAVVGKPNVGKSTLINSLLGKKRHIVSPVPGTTRDATDSVVSYYGKKFLFIDTAGIRKKNRSWSLEGLSAMRAIRSIEKADVVIIVIDASQGGIGEQEQKIAGIVDDFGKGALLFFNKWDIVADPETEFKRIGDEIKRKLWFIDYAPWITASGANKTRITKIFPLISEIMEERKKKIKTPELNNLLANIIDRKPFPLYRGKPLKFYYIAQTGIEPPTFKLFVNYPAGVRAQHISYIEKALRSNYSFRGTPLRIFVKGRENMIK